MSAAAAAGCARVRLRVADPLVGEAQLEGHPRGEKPLESELGSEVVGEVLEVLGEDPEIAGLPPQGRLPAHALGMAGGAHGAIVPAGCEGEDAQAVGPEPLLEPLAADRGDRTDGASPELRELGRRLLPHALEARHRQRVGETPALPRGRSCGCRPPPPPRLPAAR